jgi:transposase
MDNVRFHKAPAIITLFKDSVHELVFLLPYSSFLNPIENVFSKWKNYVKLAAANTKDELYTYI